MFFINWKIVIEINIEMLVLILFIYLFEINVISYDKSLRKQGPVILKTIVFFYIYSHLQHY